MVCPTAPDTQIANRNTTMAGNRTPVSDISTISFLLVRVTLGTGQRASIPRHRPNVTLQLVTLRGLWRIGSPPIGSLRRDDAHPWPRRANSCPYRVPVCVLRSQRLAGEARFVIASGGADVDDFYRGRARHIRASCDRGARRRRCVRRERFRTHGGHGAACSQYTRSVGIRTRSVASAYTSPDTGTGPDRDTYSAVKLVRRQSGSERQSQSGALQRSADQRHQQLPEPPEH